MRLNTYPELYHSKPVKNSKLYHFINYISFQSKAIKLFETYRQFVDLVERNALLFVGLDSEGSDSALRELAKNLRKGVKMSAEECEDPSVFEPIVQKE